MGDLKFKTIAEFYPYYLTQHRAFLCRMLHFIGTGLVIIVLAASLIAQIWWLLLTIPVIGYGFAWIGHFLFEKNKPAAFSNPLFSLACDFIMFWHILTGQIGVKLKEAERIHPL